VAAGGLVLLAAAGGLVALARYGGYYEPLAAGPAPPPKGKRPRDPQASLAALAPRGVYVLVDTYRNRLRIVRDGELLREAVCSTGSGTVLRDPETGREWVFDTPFGERRVLGKRRDPIWYKPDWAFIEEGYQPPPMGSADRVDDFSLGDYGLYLGEGYIIHGTVFQTLLGQRLTHGCIRLGDDDLEYAYKTVPLGARVYLF